MATRLGPKAKKPQPKRPPAPAEDPAPREQEGDRDESSSDEELDTRAMVEEQLRSVGAHSADRNASV